MKLILSAKPLHLSLPNSQDIVYFDLSSLKIAPCMGCFGCWTKTPGRCVIRDDATRVYPCIAQSDTLLYVTPIRYGGYDSVMKTMLERAIPVQQAFIRIYHGETHHVQRAVTPKKATIVVYGDYPPDEQQLFRDLVARNAHNMSFETYQILFVPEAELDQTVQNIVQTWEK